MPHTCRTYLESAAGPCCAECAQPRRRVSRFSRCCGKRVPASPIFLTEMGLGFYKVEFGIQTCGTILAPTDPLLPLLRRRDFPRMHHALGIGFLYVEDLHRLPDQPLRCLVCLYGTNTPMYQSQPRERVSCPRCLTSFMVLDDPVLCEKWRRALVDPNLDVHMRSVEYAHDNRRRCVGVTVHCPLYFFPLRIDVKETEGRYSAAAHRADTAPLWEMGSDGLVPYVADVPDAVVVVEPKATPTTPPRKDDSSTEEAPLW